MRVADAPRLRVLHGGSEGIGSYVRAGRNDHVALSQAVVESVGFSGLVLEAGYEDRHRELRAEAHARGVETVLDPMVMELATPGGVERPAIAGLPWGSKSPRTPGDFTTVAIHDLAQQLADFVATRGLFSGVVAPTHFIQDSSSAWFARDLELVAELREALDRVDPNLVLYYRLATTTGTLRDSRKAAALVAGLRNLDIDAIWLRLHPFGTSNAGPIALRGYAVGARRLHALGRPVVGEHTGTIGVGLSSMGAIGGIESGVTIGERVDMSSLLRPSPTSNEPFAPSPRVYIGKLGVFMTRDKAESFFGHRSMKSLACADPRCCRRGVVDMLAAPKQHFLRQRAHEVQRLAKAPDGLRAELYLSEHLRPASDLVVRASQVDPTLLGARHRLEMWRITLSKMSEEGQPTTRSTPALGRRYRRGAPGQRIQHRTS